MSTGFVDCDKLIRSRINTQITSGGDGGASIPTQFPNQEFAPPGGDVSWLSVHIMTVDRNQADFGSANSRNRRRGYVQVNVYTPLGKGDKASNLLVDRIVSAMEKRSEGGSLVYLGARVDAPRPMGKHWMVPVVIPFYYDDFSQGAA